MCGPYTTQFTPYAKAGPLKKCEVCKAQLHQDAKYCNPCAYKKGACSMCGVPVMSKEALKGYNQVMG